MKAAMKSLYSINPKKKLKAYLETCASLLKELSSKCLIVEGSAVHAHLIKMGISSERFIAVKLLIMYLNCTKNAEANEVMREFGGFNLVAQNCMVNAKVQGGNVDEARRLFDEMPVRNDVSWTALISGFMKQGRIEEAMRYFERNPFQNVVSWTAAISGLVQNRFSVEALKLFLRLLESGIRPNQVTFTSVVKACGELGNFGFGMSVLGLIVKAGFEHNTSVCNSLITLCLRMGEIDVARRIFDRMGKRDVVSWTAILDMYVQTGDLAETRRIFDEMPERNEVSWSAIIARYSQSGYPEEALKLFGQMVAEGFKPTIPCFACILGALASLEALPNGRSIHAQVMKFGVAEDVYISSSLIDLYCKCGETKDGRMVFDSMTERNVVSWNSMIGGYSLNGQMLEARDLFDSMPTRNNVSCGAIVAGYVEHGQFDEAFEVFNDMLLSGEMPTVSTFSSLFCACANVASLEKGKNLHGKLIKLGARHDSFLGTALVDMYAKCGDIESSKQVFGRMQEKDETLYTAMIHGLAESGFAKESLALFEEMDRTSSITPNELMLLSILFACSHSGLVDKGVHYFTAMKSVYGIEPRERHYNCVVDMLSRAGRLYEAEEFIKAMPFEPSANALAALLSGCNTYKNEEIADRTARKLREVAGKSSPRYVLLSNIHASAGQWADVSNIRKLMTEKGLKKNAGCSWFEVKNHVHSFYAEDGVHSKSPEIYEILELLRSEMLVSGHP